MTNEEAIRHLMSDWFIASGGRVVVDVNEKDAFIEAMGLAVKALHRSHTLIPDGWISVKDRLPDEEQDVLVLVEEVEVYGKHDERKHKWYNIFVGYCDDGNWLTSYCFGCEYIAKVNEDFDSRKDKSRVKVTHWMPLPELPKGDDGD